MAARDPSWSSEAKSLLKQSSDDFKQSLKDISEGIARHEPSERVLERHVKEAFALLAIAGNKRRPWYLRHELEIAVGGMLLGASTSVRSIAEVFFPADTPWRQAIVLAVTIVLIGAGLLLVVHGWLRVQQAIVWTCGPFFSRLMFWRKSQPPTEQR